MVLTVKGTIRGYPDRTGPRTHLVNLLFDVEERPNRRGVSWTFGIEDQPGFKFKRVQCATGSTVRAVWYRLRHKTIQETTTWLLCFFLFFLLWQLDDPTSPPHASYKYDAKGRRHTHTHTLPSHVKPSGAAAHRCVVVICWFLSARRRRSGWDDGALRPTRRDHRKRVPRDVHALDPENCAGGPRRWAARSGYRRKS